WPATSFTGAGSGTPGPAPAAPFSTAATTAANSNGDARGRAASWTTTISTSPGTAAKPARTDPEGVAAPATTASTPGSLSPARSGATTRTMPSATLRAAATAQSSTRRSPRSSYCFGEPNRVPVPAATTTAQTLAMTTCLLRGRHLPVLGLEGGEQHPADRRLDVRGHAHGDRVTDPLRRLAHDDHRPVVEEADALARLPPRPGDGDAKELTGHVHRTKTLGQLIEVETGHALHLGHPLQVEVRRHEAHVEAAGQGHELGVDHRELGDLVVEDMKGDTRIALEGVEHFQAPAA